MRKTARSGATETEDYLKLDRLVCFPLYVASNLLTRLYRPILAELGLTYPQYLVMLVLWESVPQSVGALGEKLHLDSGTLTPLLKRLEAADFVTRRRDAADDRRVLIGLTENGRNLRELARHVPLTLARGLAISEEETEQLRKAVSNLVSVLSIRDSGLPASSSVRK